VIAVSDHRKARRCLRRGCLSRSAPGQGGFPSVERRYGPSPPLAVQDLGSQGSRAWTAELGALKSGTVVVVVAGGTVVVVVEVAAAT